MAGVSGSESPSVSGIDTAHVVLLKPIPSPRLCQVFRNIEFSGTQSKYETLAAATIPRCSETWQDNGK